MADLTSWSTVQNRFGLDSEQEEETEHLISVASARAESHAGRILAATDVTWDLSGRGTRKLIVGEWPINSVDSVYIDSDRSFGSDTEVTDYVILSELGQLWRDKGWPRGVANIRVEANVGYDPVPADLEESIIQLVGYWLDAPTINWIGGEEGTEGGYQSQYTGVMDIPFQIAKIWMDYRKIPV